MNYKFVDLSHYEPNIDWDELRNTGIDTIITKATQGLVKDRSFSRLWQEAKNAGFYRGSYHFYDGLYTSNNPKRQAEFYFESHAGDLGELPLWADIEGKYAYQIGAPYTGWRNWYDFLERLKQLVGNKEIGIYTSWGTFESNSPTEQGQRDYFANYPLWVAHYTGNSQPLIPSVWKNKGWTFWQYSESEIVPGVYDYYYDSNGNPIPNSRRVTSVDVNWFNGTKEQFIARFNLDGSLPTEPTPEEPPVVVTPPQTDAEIHGGIVMVTTLNVRDNPSVTSNAFATFDYGNNLEFKYVKNSDPVYQWGQIQSGEYIGAYCAIRRYDSIPYVAVDVPAQYDKNIILSNNSIYRKVFRFGSWCNILIVNNPKAVKVNVSPRTVTKIANETNADFAVNGGDFSFSNYVPVGLCVSDGKIITGNQDAQPFMNFSVDSVPSIMPAKDYGKAYNAIAGKRNIVIDGKVSPYTSDAWYEKHPRTIFGITKTGKAMFMVADGRQPFSAGLNLFESAQVMIEFGAQFAVDGDGGASSALWIKELGGIVNIPIEAGIPMNERIVADHFLIYTGAPVEEPNIPETGESMLVKVLKQIRVRKQPSFYAEGVADVYPDYEFNTLDIVETSERIPPLGTNYKVRWAKKGEFEWVPFNHFSNGDVYLQEVVVTEPPIEPPVEPTPVEIESIVSARVIAKMTDGSIKTIDLGPV